MAPATIARWFDLFLSLVGGWEFGEETGGGEKEGGGVDFLGFGFGGVVKVWFVVGDSAVSFWPIEDGDGDGDGDSDGEEDKLVVFVPWTGSTDFWGPSLVCSTRRRMKSSSCFLAKIKAVFNVTRAEYAPSQECIEQSQ